MFLTLALGAMLALGAVGGSPQQADAALADKVVFASNRTAGAGVNNPTGDFEIFRMNPDGTGVRQLTSNKVTDYAPTLSPDGTKVGYISKGVQTSNTQGDIEVYVMNASDGTGKKNLSNNGLDASDHSPRFSPGGKRIAYESYGVQQSNSEGDQEVYVVNALDGTGKKNLTDNGADVYDYLPDFSPDGKKIGYTSFGDQPSNLEGDSEVYAMNASDGTGKKNLTDNADGVDDSFAGFSPDGTRVAYTSAGTQDSNLEGDFEVYVMDADGGSGQKNLTNNGDGVYDHSPRFSPGGKRIAYESFGDQPSNLEGDYEVYVMNALDGTDNKNLTNNGADVDDSHPSFSSDGTRIVYTSEGVQHSNEEGDGEIYRTNILDGTGKRNLTDNRVAYDGYYLPGQS